MKDFHWFIILGSILITPLLPYLLKARCPSCRKRKMQSLDTVKQTDGDTGLTTYVTLHKCDHCQTLFRQEKSGPLTPASEEEVKRLQREVRESELLSV